MDIDAKSDLMKRLVPTMGRRRFAGLAGRLVLLVLALGVMDSRRCFGGTPFRRPQRNQGNDDPIHHR